MSELLTDLFSAIYIVNLPERTDRRAEIETELKKAHLSYRNENIIVFPAIKPVSAKGFPGIGARGCFLSHLEILRSARQRQLESILIMEDDLAISPKLQALLPELREKLSHQNWSLLYLGHVIPVDQKSSLSLNVCHEPVLTTHFYAVNGAIFDRLIAFLETVLTRPAGHPDGGPMHYDGALNTFRQQNPDILTLLTTPNLGWQRSSRSDVASTKWFDKIPVLNHLAAQARKIMNRINQ